MTQFPSWRSHYKGTFATTPEGSATFLELYLGFAVSPASRAKKN
jgi:hypothetical protein